MTTRSEKAGILLQWSSELLLEGDTGLAALLSTAAGKMLTREVSKPAPKPAPVQTVVQALPPSITKQFEVPARKAPGKPPAVTVDELPPVLRQTYDAIAGWPGVTSRDLGILLDKDPGQIRQMTSVLEARNLVRHEVSSPDKTGGRSPFRWFITPHKAKEGVK